MTKHPPYPALLALFVGGLAAVPLPAQTQEQGVPVAHNERAPNRVGHPVTVRVRNNNWLDMRIHVVETATGRRRWRLGNVTSLSTDRFDFPDHLGAERGRLILVTEAIGSRSGSSPIAFRRGWGISWIEISVPY